MKTKLLMIVVLTLLMAASGLAANRTVTTTSDAGAGSLRQAITDASPGDTINFDVTGIIVLTSGELQVCKNLTIAGPGATTLTLSGNNAARVFNICPEFMVTIQDLTIANGYSTNGGGIYNNAGSLALLNCTFQANTARGADGCAQPSWVAAQPAAGGAVYNLGTIHATNCLFTGNYATGGSGPWSYSPPYPPSGFDSGARGAGGGVLNANGAVFEAVGTTFRYCVATGGAGATRGDFPSGGDGKGGAILNQGQLRLWGVTLTANQAVGGSGGAYFGYVDTYAPGGAGAGGGIENEAGAVNLSGGLVASNSVSSGLSGGGAGVRGGGICLEAGTAGLAGVVLSDNCASGSAGRGSPYAIAGEAVGGAIYSLGTVAVTNCTFLRNRAQAGDMDGVPTSVNGADARGGAVCNDASSPFQAVQSAFLTNTAVAGRAGMGMSAPSGGVAQGGAIAGDLVFVNVSLAGNQATGGVGGSYFGGGSGDNGSGGNAYGGALYGAGTASFTNCTLTDNSAIGGLGGQSASGPPGSSGTAQGGGIAFASGGTLKNTIVAYSTSGGNLWGSITDAGNNLSSDATGGFTAGTSHLNTDPLLGPPGNYGGFTPTVPLLYGSPAINTGDTAAAPATDQRGFSRFGSAADIGAYEWGAAPPITPQFTGIRQPATNRTELQLSGEIGRRFELHASSNLTQWFWLTNLTNTSGSMPYTDTSATNQPRRFYKATQLP
jgi:hypothetical protein